MLFLVLLVLSLQHLANCFVEIRTTGRFGAEDHKPMAPFTEIQFDGVFTCSLNTTYCLTGYIEEEDSWSSNEYMYRFPFYCSSNVSLAHNVRVNFTGGDGFLDDMYDPVIELYHNCSTNRKVRQIFHRFQRVVHSKTFYEFNYEQILLDDGINHPYLEDFTDVGAKWEPFVFEWIYNERPIDSYELSEKIPYFYNETLNDSISLL